MSILVNKNSRVITQGMTGKTGQFHTRLCRDYGFGPECFVGGVNPKKAGQEWEGLPIFGTVKEARAKTGANVSVIYVPQPERQRLFRKQAMQVSNLLSALRKAFL